MHSFYLHFKWVEFFKIWLLNVLITTLQWFFMQAELKFIYVNWTNNRKINFQEEHLHLFVTNMQQNLSKIYRHLWTFCNHRLPLPWNLPLHQKIFFTLEVCPSSIYQKKKTFNSFLHPICILLLSNHFDPILQIFYIYSAVFYYFFPSTSFPTAIGKSQQLFTYLCSVV